MGVFGPRNVFPPKCMSTEPSVCTGILLSSRYVPQSHTMQHETFLCMRDMVASGKYQPSRQRGKGETAVLSGSQGGCVFRQDCLSTRRRILASLKCCSISPSFSGPTQLTQLGHRLQQNRAHSRKPDLSKLPWSSP